MLENSNPGGWEPGTKHAHQCTLLSKLLQKEPKAHFGLVNARGLSIGVIFLAVCLMFSLRGLYLLLASSWCISSFIIYIQHYLCGSTKNVTDKSLWLLAGHGDYAYQQSSYTEQSYDRSFDDSTQHYYEGGRKIQQNLTSKFSILVRYRNSKLTGNINFIMIQQGGI